MSFAMPQLIVTLPGRSAGRCREQAEVAAGAGADIVELRFDRMPEAERARLTELLPLARPALGTVRSRSEGGEGPDEPAIREELLARLGQLPLGFLDQEIMRDGRPPGPEGAAPCPVASVHLRRPPRRPELEALLRRPAPPQGWVKIVQEAGIGELFSTVLPALQTALPGRRVLHTTGPSGALLRLWARRFGMPAVFASLPRSYRASGPVEPTQLPVDRLRAFLQAGLAGRAYGLVGHPVDGSLSPALHDGWMASGGLPGVFVGLDVAEEREFLESIEPLREGGFRGLNVTRPWKEAALGAAKSASRAAERARAANLLRLEPDGATEAENTDVVALSRRLRELRDAGSWDGEQLLIAGTGATARSSVVAAELLGARVELWGRRPEAVAEIAREFGVEPAGDRVAPLLVNATPVQLTADAPALPGLAEHCGPSTYLLDWSYGATAPARASQRGEDGRRLLVYQAAASFASWWGSPPDIAEGLREVGLA